MYYFNYKDLHANSRQYDAVRAFCRCERIDDEHFRSSIRGEGSSHYAMKKIITSILILILSTVVSIAGCNGSKNHKTENGALYE
jgi:hypothetical protein